MYMAVGAVHQRRINLRAATPLVILGDRLEGLQPRIRVLWEVKRKIPHQVRDDMYMVVGGTPL